MKEFVFQHIYTIGVYSFLALSLLSYKISKRSSKKNKKEQRVFGNKKDKKLEFGSESDLVQTVSIDCEDSLDEGPHGPNMTDNQDNDFVENNECLTEEELIVSNFIYYSDKFDYDINKVNPLEHISFLKSFSETLESLLNQIYFHKNDPVSYKRTFSLGFSFLLNESSEMLMNLASDNFDDDLVTQALNLRGKILEKRKDLSERSVKAFKIDLSNVDEKRYCDQNNISLATKEDIKEVKKDYKTLISDLSVLLREHISKQNEKILQKNEQLASLCEQNNEALSLFNSLFDNKEAVVKTLSKLDDVSKRLSDLETENKRLKEIISSTSSDIDFSDFLT